MGVELLDRADAPSIDPRIRARRIEVRRGAGLRRLQRLVDLATVLGVALAFFGALWTPLLDVDEVRVVGVEQLEPDAILSAADVHQGDPLVRVDLTSAGERIASLPWVKEVLLDRGIDGVVTIEVTERVAVATVEVGDQLALVDAEGRVLGPAPADAGPSLLALVGTGTVPSPGGYLAEAAEAVRLAGRLRTDAPDAFTSIEIDGLVAHLAQGGAVRFGDASQLEAKLRSLRTMLDQVDLSCLKVIDLRLPSSAVLTRDEACS